MRFATIGDRNTPQCPVIIIEHGDEPYLEILLGAITYCDEELGLQFLRVLEQFKIVPRQ